MWADIVKYLKDPHLVARFQEVFGIKIHYNEESSNDASEEPKISTKYTHSKYSISNQDREKVNGYRRPDSDSSSNEESQDKEKHRYPYQTTEFSEQKPFTITNQFWYYLFLFGTELGDEIFYSTFIPFWFWNVDGNVGRRVVLVWAMVMTIGQVLKDVIRWPRPACPPAARLQVKWSQEYGMPSTHAMIGVSIPFGVVLFTMNRYTYPLSVGCFIAFLWCTLICASRIYLGMHTLLDVVAGLLLAITLMIPLVPLVDITDYYIITNFGALSILITISILIIVYYPCGEKWTPTRGDTTMVVSVTAGVHVGAWLNYKMGLMTTSAIPLPYSIFWPSYSMLARSILRTTLGFSTIIATKVTCKRLTYATMCAIFQIESKELLDNEDRTENKNKILFDLVYKYVTCFMIGLNTVYFLPIIFSAIGIERPAFYTEI